MIHRFQKGADRIARTGISLAVEIVDKVSDEALLGLTVRHAIDSFIPAGGDIGQGLDVLNDLFGKIFYKELPIGHDWLDHLDILNAVRLTPFGGLKKVAQFYPEQLSGYVDVGIEKNSENHNKAIEILKRNNLPSSILIDHTFNSDFLRLCVARKKSIDELSMNIQIVDDGKLVTIQQKLSQEQKQAIQSIYELYTNDDIKKQNNINSFMSEWDKRSNLKILREWWDSISTGFTVTTVGKVLAHSNAQRCDKNLPPLD
jgi:hypothetical protein